ncbi:MAG: DUF2149 domain-containing protein [Flavobacteriaceae bacterium]|nr:DUF2149 domain-containing protein [Flavobacteriaceae bacterium]
MRRGKFLNNSEDDDPMAGMANLFDVAMVFALALMVALVTRFNMPEMMTNEDFTIVKNPGKPNMEIIKRTGKTIEKYKGTKGKSSNGKGKKVGTAYQLENGEIIYIPED